MKCFLVFTLLCSSMIVAQQEPVSGMYWNNYSFSNPAMSGVNFKHEANVTHRSNWSRVNDFPTNWFANYGINLGGKHGIGVNYVNTVDWFRPDYGYGYGYSRINEIKLNYNYQFDLKGGRKLVVGAALSRSEWNPFYVWALYCGKLPQDTKTFQADLGVAYYGKSITAGLAMTRIPMQESSDYLTYQPSLNGNFRFEGSLLGLPELIYETRFQTDFISYRQDFNLGYKIKNILEVGIGYRTSDAALINLTGIIAQKFRVGYSYAHSVNKISNYSRGTHEIALGFRIPNK